MCIRFLSDKVTNSSNGSFNMCKAESCALHYTEEQICSNLETFIALSQRGNTLCHLCYMIHKLSLRRSKYSRRNKVVMCSSKIFTETDKYTCHEFIFSACLGMFQNSPVLI